MAIFLDFFPFYITSLLFQFFFVKFSFKTFGVLSSLSARLTYRLSVSFKCKFLSYFIAFVNVKAVRVAGPHHSVGVLSISSSTCLPRDSLKPCLNSFHSALKFLNGLSVTY